MAALLSAGPARSQSASAPAEGTAQIETVTVTAERRQEDLETVPIAVTALSQDAMKLRGIDGGSNLVLALPNVTFAQTDTGYNFQIRGIGTKLLGSTGDAGVAVHENDVPLISNSLADADFFDVQRVEVLRGPQGTLYGRNATGGAINVITNKPTDTLDGSLSAEIGNFDSRKFTGFINVPIGDKLAVRVAGFDFQRDGFDTNTLTGGKLDSRNIWSTRASVAYSPSESFHATLMWEHFSESDTHFPWQGFCVKDPGPTAVLGVPTDALTQGLLSQGCLPGSLYSPAVRGTVNSSATLGGMLANLTGLVNGDAYAGKVQSQNLRDVESFGKSAYQPHDDVAELNLEWQLSQALTVTSLTGYATRRYYTRGDDQSSQASVPFNITAVSPGGVFNDPQIGSSNLVQEQTLQDDRNHQWSQELRLESNFDGPVNFSVGANYINYQDFNKYYVILNTATAYSEIENFFGAGIYIDPLQKPDGTGHNYYLNQDSYKLTSIAGFGEVYWQATDTLRLTGGVRYTQDQKSVVNYPVVLFDAGRGFSSTSKENVTFAEPTGRANIAWTPKLSFTDQSMFYASYSHGYKSGGFNPPNTLANAATFAPEFVDAVELGTKNVLDGGHLVLNLTGFNYNYNGYQVSKVVDTSVINENINATVRGVEFEGAWRPDNAFGIDANVGYLSTRISSGSSVDTLNPTQGDPAYSVVKAISGANCVVPSAQVAGVLAMIDGGLLASNSLLGICSGSFAGYGINPTDGIPVNLAGKQLPNAPHWTISVGPQYTLHFESGWSATLRTDFYYQSASYARIYNSVSDQLHAWNNMNASLTVANDHNGWQAQLFVKNAFNANTIVNSELDDASVGLLRSISLLDPRLFGIRLTKSF
jgi:outer membrane receptor protein involved in Fe transport